VRLARALALDPDVVLREHPTAGLEPQERAKAAADAGDTALIGGRANY
jgi:ABC-type transporter Mla maintaining outer membrane lipid asymmetry ATPase subunit MlaF